MEYKRLTKRDCAGYVVPVKPITSGYDDNNTPIVKEELLDRLAELEDKIEAGKLIFIDKPFWSEYHDCWAVFQRTEDIVQTCYMTVNQAKDYKAKKILEEMKNGI